MNFHLNNENEVSIILVIMDYAKYTSSSMLNNFTICNHFYLHLHYIILQTSKKWGQCETNRVNYTETNCTKKLRRQDEIANVVFYHVSGRVLIKNVFICVQSFIHYIDFLGF